MADDQSSSTGNVFQASDNIAGSDNWYEQKAYQNWQVGLLELISVFSATMSTIGSGMVLWFIWWNRKQSFKKVYHRIIAGTSIYDLFSSFGLTVLGPWATATDAQYTLLGAGNFQTCSAAGFFLNLQFGATWYSVALAVYFLLLVRFEWKERTIAKVEPIGHVLAFLIAVPTGIYAIIVDTYSPFRHLPGWCWITEYPIYCDRFDDVECLRGTSTTALAIERVYVFVSGLSSVSIFLCMLFLVRKVRRTELQLRNYAGGQNSTLDRTKETGIQALLYIGAFYSVNLPIIAMSFISSRDEPDSNKGLLFSVALLCKFFFPLQGAFNAYIFLRKQFRDLCKEGQCFFCLCKIPLIGVWFQNEAQRKSIRRARPSTQETDNDPSDRPDSSFRLFRSFKRSRSNRFAKQDSNDLEEQEEEKQQQPKEHAPDGLNSNTESAVDDPSRGGMDVIAEDDDDESPQPENVASQGATPSHEDEGEVEAPAPTEDAEEDGEQWKNEN